ncbi:MAG: hypothetical protein ABIX01_13980 [Chitinophagaceae bacterium]
MKKNILHLSAICISFALLVISCKKEIAPINAEDVLTETANAGHANSESCRLVKYEGLDDGYMRKMHYNNKGLVDQWTEFHPWYDLDEKFTFAYDNNKHITTVKEIDHGTLKWTIVPKYHGDRIVYEIWYVGDTHIIDDTTVNTYNRMGQIVKRESLAYDVYATFQYDLIGNQTIGNFYDLDGTLEQSEIFKYKKLVKEPITTVSGLPYGIPYINFVFSPLHFTYYKASYRDENGIMVPFFELDPASQLIAGPQGYAVAHNTFDLVSQLGNRQRWSYDNCNCSFDDDALAPGPPTQHASKGAKPNSQPLHLSFKEMRQKIDAVRMIRLQKSNK